MELRGEKVTSAVEEEKKKKMMKKKRGEEVEEVEMGLVAPEVKAQILEAEEMAAQKKQTTRRPRGKEC